MQFAASVTTIFRQNGSSVNTIIKRTLDPGLYLSNFIRGVEVLAIEVDDRAIRGFLNDMRYINPRFTYLLTYLMHRYMESRPPLAFFNSSRGVRNFRGGGSTPQFRSS